MAGPNPASTRQHVRYEPDERPPLPMTAGLGLQYALICIASIILTPTVMITVAGGSAEYLSWAVFAALVVSGITTAIQARRVGRIGAGYILVMGSTSAFLAVSVTALEQGGPAMLATLIIASALVQFVLAERMALLRRIFTPTVAGTVLILIPVTLAPMIVRKLGEVPLDASPAAGPVTAAVTLLVMILIPLRFTGALRLWAPAIGIIAGGLTASLGFGIYDFTTVREAAWIGLPDIAYPGVDFSFRPEFWALLPSFIMVTLVGAMDTLGDSIAIQRVSWRRPRAIDFRSIQGAISADGVGNLLSGLAGTVPNTTYGMSISVAELTGVASRAIGIAVGAVFVALAFLPKFVTLIVAMPGPVVAAYFVVIVALIFVFGMRILLQDGLDHRKGLIVGVAFWIGFAFQLDWIYPEYWQGAWGELLGNGMTVGGFAVILLTLFGEITRGRRSRLKTRLTAETWPDVDAFLVKFAARKGWGEQMETRLRAVGEETMQILTRGEVSADGAEGRAGADGADGADGAEGRAGADGADGADGAEGRTGADGADGAEGRAGADGADGADGAEGRTGADGADGAADPERRLLLLARGDGDAADLEFIATTDQTNLEDQLAMLTEVAGNVPVDAETPLRLLRHYASSIRHQQYHDIDILTIRVEGSG